MDLKSIDLPEPPAGEKDCGDDASFDAWCAYEEAVASLIGASARWSAGSVDFREVARKGTWRVVYEAGAYWSDRGTLASPAMADPTWLELFAAADHAIAASGDGHHVFIESFEPAGDGALLLSTGS